MSTMPPGRPPVVNPQEDVFLTLLITSAAVLLIGLVFLAVRSVQLFGSLFPPSGA